MAKTKSKKTGSSDKGYPSARVGNYRAPVDTTGMDPAMKRTMGFGKKGSSKKKGK